MPIDKEELKEIAREEAEKRRELKRKIWQERRLKVFMIGATTLLQYLASKTWIRLKSGSVPDDAVVVSLRDDFQTSSIVLLVYSDTFEAVPEGMVPPRGDEMLVFETKENEED